MRKVNRQINNLQVKYKHKLIPGKGKKEVNL